MPNTSPSPLSSSWVHEETEIPVKQFVAEVTESVAASSGGGSGPEDPMLEQRVDRLEEKMERIDRALERIEPKITEMVAKLDTRFEAVNVRFEMVNTRFTGVEEQLKGIDRRFIAVDQRFASIEGRLNSIPGYWQMLGIISTMLVGLTGIIFAAARFLKP